MLINSLVCSTSLGTLAWFMQCNGTCLYSNNLTHRLVFRIINVRILYNFGIRASIHIDF
jgi:hypothetical protein